MIKYQLIYTVITFLKLLLAMRKINDRGNKESFPLSEQVQPLINYEIVLQIWLQRPCYAYSNPAKHSL